ncbi:MAG: hypothetical protein O3B04_09655 [Chloroflexi bacterium]|nr:hypothetical protein [Chloroflexota bacterium]
MTMQQGKTTDAKTTNGGAASQASASAGDGSGTDWKKAHDGQLLRVRELTSENAALRSRADNVESLTRTVAELAGKLNGMELTSAELFDRVTSARSDDTDEYGDEPTTGASKTSSDRAAAVRARHAAEALKGFAAQAVKAEQQLKENFVYGMSNTDPLVVEAVALFNDGRAGRDGQRLFLAVEKMKLARQAAELNAPSAGDDSGDGETDTQPNATSDPEELPVGERAPSKRQQLSKSGALSEQSGGGEAAPTDQYADLSPSQLFAAAARGEGPQRS